MTCDRYRPQLALLVGNDLDLREASEVRQHLGGCPACQAQWDALQASTGVLHSVARQSSLPASGSLWPQIRSKLAVRPTVAPASAPSWYTIGAFSAVCAAVVWLTLSTPVFDFDVNNAGLTEFEGGRDVVKPASNFPALHLVDDVQPPVQIFPEGEVPPPRLPAPPTSFGDPRSF